MIGIVGVIIHFYPIIFANSLKEKGKVKETGKGKGRASYNSSYQGIAPFPPSNALCNRYTVTLNIALNKTLKLPIDLVWE